MTSTVIRGQKFTPVSKTLYIYEIVQFFLVTDIVNETHFINVAN